MSAAHQPNSVSVLDGKYALLRQLGSGGTGTVYEAENLIVGKRIAIKLMNAGAFAERDSQARFVAEARAAARIAHANVVDIHDLGVSRDGVPYIVMELLRGETLEDVIDTRGPLAPPYACELFLQVLGGVDHAHANLIVHRDLKPSNILVTPNGTVKLLEFGIATLREEEAAEESALTDPGKWALTPAYAAPEQVTGAPVTTATDVYALGVLLYILLTGRHPTGEGNLTLSDHLTRILDREPPRLSASIAP